MIESEALGKHLIIEGFKDVRINNVEGVLNIIRTSSGNCHIQILDGDYVAGFEHILFAVLNSLKAFKAGYNISKSITMEILLFASGQDQIKRAIELLGVKERSRNVILVIVAERREDAISALNSIKNSLGWMADQSVIELNNEKIPKIIEAFKISPEELEASMRGSLEDAIKNVIIEKIALLVAQR